MRIRSGKLVWQYRTPLFTLLLASIALAGCGGSGSNNSNSLTRSALVGTWRKVSTEENETNYPCPTSGYCGNNDTIQFDEDNTFIYNVEWAKRNRMVGTWSVTGEKLSLDITKAEIDLNSDGDFDDPNEVVLDPLTDDISATVSKSAMIWNLSKGKVKSSFERL